MLQFDCFRTMNVLCCRRGLEPKAIPSICMLVWCSRDLNSGLIKIVLMSVRNAGEKLRGSTSCRLIPITSQWK